MSNRTSRKSQEGQLVLSFYQALITEDLPRMHGGLEEFSRDYQTIARRTRSEGLSFLTKTLPKFGKLIDKALQGELLLTSDFRKRVRTVRGKRVRYVLPNFLWVLLSKVFNPFTGRILLDADVCAINDLRQICFLAYKLELPYDQEIIGNTLDQFVEIDAQLPDEQQLGEVRSKHKILDRALDYGNMFLRAVCADVDFLDIQPKHGPGVVATGERPWEKFNFPTWYHQLEVLYPYEVYCTLNRSHYWSNLYRRDFTMYDYGEAKVMLVPKDSRGPRLISAEPLAYQYVQQGIGRKLVETIEHHPLTRGRVNFSSQQVNRNLALKGSETGEFETLDMSEASDRVSMALVESLFKDIALLDCLKAARTPCTKLPDKRVVWFRKYAPMGSALCFPVEALCFWALAAGILHAHGWAAKEAARQVWVYGDDIVVRKGIHVFLMHYFPLVGLKFNEDKCCTTGFFRESCGCDAYRGQDVTPLKMKRLPPSRKTADARPFLAFIEYSNSLWRKAYYSTSKAIESHVTKIYGPVPPKVNSVDDSVLMPSWYIRPFRSSREIKGFKRRWNKELQRFEFLVPLIRTRSLDRNSPVWCELLRKLRSSKHTRAYNYTLPRRVRIKRGWTSLV
jgi:hypothetical protein